MMRYCTKGEDCRADVHESGCAHMRDKRLNYRYGNGDALSNRAAEPGSPEWDYLHRYDSPDNQRDSMG